MSGFELLDRLGSLFKFLFVVSMIALVVVLAAYGGFYILFPQLACVCAP